MQRTGKGADLRTFVPITSVRTVIDHQLFTYGDDSFDKFSFNQIGIKVINKSLINGDNDFSSLSLNIV